MSLTVNQDYESSSLSLSANFSYYEFFTVLHIWLETTSLIGVVFFQ